MQVRIDKAADSTVIIWGLRRRGASQVIELPSGNTARLLLTSNGDIAGIEILGWSQRATEPLEVQIVLDTDPPKDAAVRDPLTEALATHGVIATTAEGQPVAPGGVMLPMIAVAERTGLERSWLTREAASGRLRSRKIGREWWTTEAWLQDYQRARTGRARTKTADAATDTKSRETA